MDLVCHWIVLKTIEFSPVMPTVLDIQSQQSPVYSIESSKDEDLNEERHLGYYEMEELTRRDRAMFGWPTTRTVTVVATQTSIVTQAVSPMHPPIGSPTGLLICVPPGLVVCVWINCSRRNSFFLLLSLSYTLLLSVIHSNAARHSRLYPHVIVGIHSARVV